MASARENEEFKDLIIVGYPLDAAIEWIQLNLSPEEVFEKEDLAFWAENNGFSEDK